MNLAGYAAASLLAVALAGGCGGSAESPRSSASPASSPAVSGRFGFDLPSGDVPAGAHDGEVYTALRAGDCAAAQNVLDRGGAGLDRSALPLLQAGVALCRGDLATAQKLFATYHRTGSETWFLCELYRRAGSVLQGQPPSVLATCPSIPPVSSASPGSAEPEPSGQPSESSEPAASPVPSAAASG